MYPINIEYRSEIHGVERRQYFVASSDQEVSAIIDALDLPNNPAHGCPGEVLPTSLYSSDDYTRRATVTQAGSQVYLARLVREEERLLLSGVR